MTNPLGDTGQAPPNGDGPNGGTSAATNNSGAHQATANSGGGGSSGGTTPTLPIHSSSSNGSSTTSNSNTGSQISNNHTTDNNGNSNPISTGTTTTNHHNHSFSISSANCQANHAHSYMAPPATPSVPVDENTRKPKHLSQWSNADVIKWLKRHCEHFYEQYGHLFLEQAITGRSLCRITDGMLESMGIEPQEHRDELRRIIMKLKLKSDMVKLKDLERA